MVSQYRRKLLSFFVVATCCATAAESGWEDSTLTAATPTPVAVKMGAPFYSGAILPTPKEAVYSEDVLLLADGPAGVGLSGCLPW